MSALREDLVRSPLVLSLALTPFLVYVRQKPSGGASKAAEHRWLWSAVLLILAVWVARAATPYAQRAYSRMGGSPVSPYVVWSLATVVALAVLAFLFWPRGAAAPPTSRQRTEEPKPRFRRLLIAVVTGVIGAVIAAWMIVSGWRVVAHAWTWTLYRTVETSTGPAFPTQGPRFAYFLASSVALCFVVRWYYIQYLGDVAAYVSSHTVNRFCSVREGIKSVGRELAMAVYGERRNGEKGPLYDRVLVVGHSLGSVVAYDTLNRMLCEELEVGKTEVRDRTIGLVTFGSPLDKTAFIFRTQLHNAEVREALAAANQPLIQPPHPDGRRTRWINLYSWFDPVSGPLGFYDIAKKEQESEQSDGRMVGHRRVENHADPAANIPLVAHTQYWGNPTLGDVLYSLVTGQEPEVCARRAAARRAAGQTTAPDPNVPR